MSTELCAIRGGGLYFVRSLDDEEYVQAKEAVDAVNRFSDNMHYYRMVSKSCEEFIGAIDRYASDFTDSTELTYFQVMELTLGTNRLLLNFLAIMNTFVEHSTTELKRQFGEDSEVVKTFQEAKSAAYDGSFAYRFLWKLRNYTIHIALPLKPDIHLRDAESDEANPRLSFYLDRDTLLTRGFHWKSEIEQEIREHPKKINIRPLVVEMMNLLDELNVSMLYNTYGQELAVGAFYLQDLWPSREIGEGYPCIRESSSTDRALMLPIAEARMISDTILENQP